MRQLFVQQRLGGRAGFDEQCAGAGGQALHPFRHAFHVLHRAQAAAIEQFNGRYRLLLEHRHCVAAGLDIREDDQRTGFVRMVRHGVVGDRTDKAQGPFGADHQVGEDIQRLVVVDQRIERQPGGVLQPVLVADFRGQLGVGAGLATQFAKACEQCAVVFTECGDARRVFAVEQGAVGQQQAHAGEGVIAVLGRTAAHAAGVVGHDAADFAGVDRGRVGADLAAERGKPGVGLGTDHARLQANLGAAVADLTTVPVVPQHQQHRIAHGLARQTGTGGAEGDCDLLGLCGLEQGGDFVFALDADNEFGNQAIEAGVGTEGQGRERVVETSLARDQVFNRVEERGGQTHAISSRDRGIWCATCPGQSGGDS
ncbi:hypothetical protein D3C77_210150 [compost metagenome]